MIPSKNPPQGAFYVLVTSIVIGCWATASFVGVFLAGLTTLEPVVGCTFGGFVAGWVARTLWEKA